MWCTVVEARHGNFGVFYDKNSHELSLDKARQGMENEVKSMKQLDSTYDASVARNGITLNYSIT